MKKIVTLVLFLAVTIFHSSAFGVTITPIAGGGTNTPTVGLPATDVELMDIYSSKADANGNVYVATYPSLDTTVPYVIRVDRWGMIDRLYEYPATPIWYFDDVCVDEAGNIYLPAYHKHVIYKLALDGTKSLYAGTLGSPGYSGDNGPATSAQLSNPESVSVDHNGNVYVSHLGADKVIRKIDRQGTITTVFDGTGLGLNYADALYVNGSGQIFFSEMSQKAVWKVTGPTTASQVATTQYHTIRGVTGDKYGNIFFSYEYKDSATNDWHAVVKKVDPFGVETTAVDIVNNYYGYPTRISTDADGMLYVNFYWSTGGSNIQKISFPPSIENISPLDAAGGERVIISGRYFTRNGDGGSVTFGGLEAPIISWDNELIVCDIPTGASKTVDVVVTTPDSQTSNLFSYRIR